jgi:hypothetical protein
MNNHVSQLALPLTGLRTCGICLVEFNANESLSCPWCMGPRCSRPGLAGGMGWEAGSFRVGGCARCGGAFCTDSDGQERCFSCGRSPTAPAVASGKKQAFRGRARESSRLAG